VEVERVLDGDVHGRDARTGDVLTRFEGAGTPP
jgi:hypothetical protein